MSNLIGKTFRIYNNKNTAICIIQRFHTLQIRKHFYNNIKNYRVIG